jgi:ABC-type branched-subunit amino acid transport system substrate-binding protein
MGIRVGAALAAAIVSFVAYGAGAQGLKTQGVSATEIVVGSHLDLSGPVAAGMPQLRNGMQMRFDEANDAGGINGRKFRLIVEDNAYAPATAVRAVQKLVERDQVFAVFQPFGTGTGVAGYQAASGAKIPHLFPWAVSQPFHADKNPGSFTYVVDYVFAAEAGVGHMVDQLKSTKVGLIYQADAFGEMVKAGTAKALKARNLDIVAEASYRPGDIDFSAQVQRLRQAQVDLVVLATIIRETIGAVGEIKKIGWNVPVLTHVPGRTVIVTALGKEAMEGLYGIGQWNIHYPDNAPAPVQEWTAKFRAKFNTAPDENAMVAYSLTDWFLKGVAAAGRDFTADSFATAFRRVKHRDLFGNPEQALDDGNHAKPETVFVEQVKNGRWTRASGPLVAK